MALFWESFRLITPPAIWPINWMTHATSMCTWLTTLMVVVGLIQVYNHPLPKTMKTKNQPDESQREHLRYSLMSLVVGLCLVTPFFSQYVISERVTGAKHLQVNCVPLLCFDSLRWCVHCPPEHGMSWLRMIVYNPNRFQVLVVCIIQILKKTKSFLGRFLKYVQK